MADDDDDALIESEESVTSDVRDADKIAARICRIHKTWVPGDVLSLDKFNWTPNLVDASKNWVLHVHVSDGMPRHVGRRLRAAAESGYLVHVALPLTALYDADVLGLLADVDAYVYVIVDGVVERDRRHVLAAIADLEIAVERDLRIAIGKATWSRMAAGKPSERGRRLEALLAFLLSQVADFRIFSRNYRTKTQEIDVVVQVTSYSGRCWFGSGVPFILVEAKNTAAKAGQPVVGLFIRKLETKRGRALIGLLFSVAGFTSDAAHEELRLSQTQFTVAMFDGSDIADLVEASDLDKVLEDHIAQSMLR